MPDQPEYTVEEKVAAFDLMWEKLGSGRPRFSHHVAKRAEDRVLAVFEPGSDVPGLARYDRVPIYEFSIRFAGSCDSFKDVLHSMVLAATNKQRRKS